MKVLLKGTQKTLFHKYSRSNPDAFLKNTVQDSVSARPNPAPHHCLLLQGMMNISSPLLENLDRTPILS